jgi:putative ABC transport system permease protein
MDIRPILSTLRRHKTAAALIVLEVALTCAIVCNALFLVSQRVERISQTSGMAENELVFVRVSGIGKQTDARPAPARTWPPCARSRRHRRREGQPAAVPPGSSNTSVSLKQEQERPTAFVTMYMFGEGAVHAWLQLTAGRDFQPSEYSNVEDARRTPPPIPPPR